MLRRIAVFAFLAFSALTQAALLPDYLGRVPKTKAQAVAAPDAQLFDEYGFDQAERAVYGDLTVTAWRFRDVTGAIAGFQYLSPADAKKSDLDKMAVAGPEGSTLVHGNYVLQFAGRAPKQEELNLFLLRAPRYQESPLPTLSGFLPDDGMIPNSERYVLGPVSLDRFAKSIPPSVAGFHLSAEGEYARYRGKNGDLGLLVLSYPVPNLARERAEELRKISGAIVKRTGPLVAVVPGGANADDAERLLAKVNYDATITVNEIPTHNQAVGLARMILNIFVLAGIILCFCLVSGLLFGGFRVLMRRLGHGDTEEGMITLHIDSIQNPPA